MLGSELFSQNICQDTACVSPLFPLFEWVVVLSLSLASSAYLGTCLPFHPSVETGMWWHGCPKSSLQSLIVQTSILPELQDVRGEDGHRCFSKAPD